MSVTFIYSVSTGVSTSSIKFFRFLYILYFFSQFHLILSSLERGGWVGSSFQKNGYLGPYSIGNPSIPQFLLNLVEKLGEGAFFAGCFRF